MRVATIVLAPSLPSRGPEVEDSCAGSAVIGGCGGRGIMRRSNWPDRTMCLGERITFASKPSECHKKLILINYIHYGF